MSRRVWGEGYHPSPHSSLVPLLLWFVNMLGGITLHLLLLTFNVRADRTSDDDYFLRPPMPPRFLDTASNVTVREGGVAALPCAIQYLGTKRVAWRKVETDQFLTIGTETWAQDENFEVQHKEEASEITTWNLVIKDVTPADGGTYECQITAQAGYAREVQLNVVAGPTMLDPVQKDNIGKKSKSRRVLEGPPITEPALSISGTQFVDVGQKIHLICNATGGPQIPEDIDWFMNGEKINSQDYDRTVITKYRSLEDRALISEVIIDKSTIEDMGTYICRSSHDRIGSFQVQVLLAETVNVKRGMGARDKFRTGRTLGHGQSSSTRVQGVCVTASVLFSLIIMRFLSLGDV